MSRKKTRRDGLLDPFRKPVGDRPQDSNSNRNELRRFRISCFDALLERKESYSREDFLFAYEQGYNQGAADESDACGDYGYVYAKQFFEPDLSRAEYDELSARFKKGISPWKTSLSLEEQLELMRIEVPADVYDGWLREAKEMEQELANELKAQDPTIT